jgi:hypothetical protein
VRGQTRRTAGAWALALALAAGSGAFAEEKTQAPADTPKVTAGPEGFTRQSASGDYMLQLR